MIAVRGRARRREGASEIFGDSSQTRRRRESRWTTHLEGSPATAKGPARAGPFAVCAEPVAASATIPVGNGRRGPGWCRAPFGWSWVELVSLWV